MVVKSEIRSFFDMSSKVNVYLINLATVVGMLFSHTVLSVCGMSWLQVIVMLPLIGIFVVFVISRMNNAEELLKLVSLNISLYILIEVLCLWLSLLQVVGHPQYISETSFEVIAGFSLNYCLGVDGITIWFMLLSAMLIPICLLLNWKSIIFRVTESIILYFVVEFFLFNVFLVLDIFLFYLFFEALLIPMYLIIGIWGSRGRRIHASYQFFLYTLLGSVAMLLAVLYIYYICGTTNWFVVAAADFSDSEIFLILGAFYLAFIVKVPLYPVHIWLPEAHVEAPTGGSVLLAGIMLKLGTYGIIKYCIFLWPEHNHYYVPIMLVITTFGIIFGSLATIRQIDLKKSIAYSSVAHMSFLVQGLFMFNVPSLEGALFLMIGHGFVSSALFICVGVVYDRYHTRIITYYGNLIMGMPIYGLLLYIFTLGNLNFPGTVNFISELFVSIGISFSNFIVMLFAGTSMILSGIYGMWLYNRIVFGPARVYSTVFCDISRREVCVLMPLLFFMLLVGIYPEFVLNNLRFTVMYYGLAGIC